MGNARTTPFTSHSGHYTLADKLAEAGVDLSPAEVADVPACARKVMADEQHLLTDEELAWPRRHGEGGETRAEAFEFTLMNSNHVHVY
ncbi:hypothetical protein [Streptomyces sp. NPDC054834]